MGRLTKILSDSTRREARLFGLAFVFILLLAVSLLLSPVVRSGQWTDVLQRGKMILVIPVWLVSAVWVHRRAQINHPHRDPFILPIAYLLTGWGLLIVWRLAPAFGYRQLAWFLVGSLVLGFVLNRPDVLGALRRYRILWLLGGILLTALTLVFGTHPSGGAQRLWLRVLGIYIQPSEPLRLLLIVYLASYFSITLPVRDTRSVSWVQIMAPLLVMWGISVGLLFVQRDLGTATLVLAILAGLLYLATEKRWVVAAAGGLAILAAGLGYAFSSVVRLRLETWINPWSDPIDSGYQMIQSLVAIASGGLLGQGPGLGSPGFIPAVHTDFVYAAVLEEMGAIGGLGMILLFAFLIQRGLRIALHHRDIFSALLGAGLSISLGFQTIYIIGGVLRILPLAGITLPFVSYGGSSLVSSLLAVGFLVILSDGNGENPRFARPIRDLNLVFLTAWSVLAVVIGWWTIYRAPILITRTDNPRRALESRYSLRGSILDRNGLVLAESIGVRGDYQRRYPIDAVSIVVGFDSVYYGKSGVEQSLDAILRGDSIRDPWEIWWSYKLYAIPPAGLDIRLTLDTAVQQAAMQTLNGRTGAVVILDAGSGEILALASSPGYLSGSLDEEWSSLVVQEDSPFINRTTQGVYQPGMALAPFTYAWALQENVFDLEDAAPNLEDFIMIDGYEFGCLHPAESEEETIAVALRRGCPAPLSALGEELEEEVMTDMLTAFGFNRTPSIRLPQADLGDLQGLSPALDAIGQGVVQVSPLQMARAWSALVGDGILPGLSLLDAVRSPEGLWEEQSTLDAPRRILEADTAACMGDIFPYLGNGVWGYPAGAITGEDLDSLSWFLGFDNSDPVRVVVIVLENSTPDEARVLGVELLGGLSE